MGSSGKREQKGTKIHCNDVSVFSGDTQAMIVTFLSGTRTIEDSLGKHRANENEQVTFTL